MILSNGLFSLAEYALIRSQPARFLTPELQSRRGTPSAIWLLDRLSLSLAVTQLWITLCTILLGVVGVQFFAQVFNDMIGRIISYQVAVLVAVIAAVMLVSLLHLVVSQIGAKSLAIHNPEVSLAVVAPFLWLLTECCKPLLYFVNFAANFFLRPFSATVPAALEHFPSASELSVLVSKSSEQGILGKSEEEMLRGVFGFSHTVAREVMTPRTDLVTLRVDATPEEALKTILDSGFSRFPVIGKAIDDVRGILLAKDLLGSVVGTDGAPIERRSDGVPLFRVDKLMRKPYFIPDTKPIDEVLSEFKRRKVHMAIVLDEHGGVDGLVTMEDLIEEIVGDIFDESDDQVNWIQVQENGDVVVDGGVLVADLNQQVGLKIPEGNYDTIAGFVFTALGRMPQAGDEIKVGPEGVLTEQSDNGETRKSAANAQTSVEPGADNLAAEPSPLTSEILVIVEKVANHRIESTRIKRVNSLRNPESEPKLPASQNES